MKINMRRFVFLIIIGFQFIGFNLYAMEKIIDVSQMEKGSISLTEYLSILEDPSLQLSLVDVQNKEGSSRFKKVEAKGESLNLGVTESAYWIRFNLKNSSNQTVERILEIAYPRIASIQLYQPVNQLYHTTYSGYANLEKQTHSSRFSIMTISVPANVEEIIYLRLESPNAMNVPAKLWEPKSFITHERNDYILQALYFGFLFAMVIFNFLLFLILKDLNYFLYCLFGLFTGFTIVADTGIGNEFLWKGSILLAKIGINIGISFMFIPFAFFMRRMLNTAILVPRLDKLIQFFFYLHIIIPFLLYFWFHQVLLFVLISQILTGILILVVGFTCSIKGHRIAILFTIALSTFFIFGIMAIMRALTILPTSVFTTMGHQFASALELMLFSFVLADKYNILRKEKETAEALVKENLKKSNLELEQKVKDRTEKLNKKNKELEASNHFKDKIFSIITHDLKGPLGSIRSYLQYKKQNFSKFSNKEFQNLFYVISGGIETSYSICDNTVHWAKNQLSLTTFNPTIIDIVPTIKENLSLLSFMADSKKIKMTMLQESEEIPEFKVDINLINFVIRNLLTNAIKFSNEGDSILLTIKTDQKNFVCSVQDNGIGMEKKELENLLRGQGENKKDGTAKEKGSGLGMPLSKQFIKLHKGKLTIESAKGKGTKVTFTIPLK